MYFEHYPRTSFVSLKRNASPVLITDTVDLHENFTISRSQTVSMCVEFYCEMSMLV